MTKPGWFSVIIPNYNGEAYLDICLASVLKSSYKNFVVIIADDCSSDKSIEIVQKYQRKHKNIKLLKSTKNLGPSGQRAKALKAVDTEYIYFLDNDTEVHKEFLTEIEKVYKADPEAGGVQSLLVDFDDRNRIQNAGLKLIPHTGWAIGILQDKHISKRPKKSIPVLGLSAALSVKKEVVDSGITFDPDFVHYSEDLDFSWRMWISGYKIVLAPNSLVYHKVKRMSERKNVGANNKIVYYHLTKNAFASLTKNYELLNFLRYFPICFAIVMARALLVLVIRKDSSSFFGTFQAVLWYFANFRRLMKKRITVQNLRQIADSGVLKNIALKENPLAIYKNYFSQTKLLPI